MKSMDAFNSVVFFHAYPLLRIPRRLLKATARRIYSGEKIPSHKNIHVIFCSDYRIKKLNAAFRNKPFPTDVLSFNYDENDFVGEIYISLQRAKIQATRYSVSYENEIVRLFVHGMIHLTGLDHQTQLERMRMEAIENKYLILQ